VRILVIEDDTTLARFVMKGLREAGFAVDHAGNGEDGLGLALSIPYDAAIVDIMLPKLDGLALIEELRRNKLSTPVIVLSAKRSVDDRIRGLHSGSDDYVTKPFAFTELVARVRALARRAPAAPPVTVRGDLVFDRARRRASRGGRPLSLTRKELAVLEELLVADGAVVSAEELLERVWDENADPFTRTVTVTLARLRRKLGEPELIETVVGSGYRLP